MPLNKYIYYLEVALAGPEDSRIYSFENVSHIPAAKLVEIFKIDLIKDPHILDGYFLTEDIYRSHKEYLDKEVGALNLEVFEYSLRLYATDEQGIRRLYKDDPME